MELARAAFCKTLPRQYPPVLSQFPGLTVVNKPAPCYVETAAQATEGAPAHRLDRDTSGVLLVATSGAALSRLSALFALQNAVQKAYVGLVASAPSSWPAGGAVLRSGHGRSAGGLWRAYKHADVGRALPSKRVRDMETRLRFFRGSADGSPALVLAVPTQGRTHQVRLHAALAGSPLLGDVRYGGAQVAQGMSLLHAARLRLPPGGAGVGQPHTTFAAPLPDWVQAAGADAVRLLVDALDEWEGNGGYGAGADDSGANTVVITA